MKKLFIFGLCLLAAGCHQKNSDQIKQDALNEIKENVNQFNKAEPCKILVNNKNDLGSDSAYEVMHLCGELFDTTKPLIASEFKVYDQQREIACGIVNGTSMAGSKLGQQFVYVGSVGTVYLKPSLARYKGKDIPMVMSKSLEIYQRMYQENCK